MSFRAATAGAALLAAVVGLSALAVGLDSSDESVAVVAQPGDDIGALIASSRAPVVELAAGRHRPFGIGRSVTVRAQRGAVVDGPIEVTGPNVRLVGLHVRGGGTGIAIRGVDGAVLDGVHVTGAELHGIEVIDASATIRDCVVSGLASEFGQGIEVRNSNGRPPTIIERCAVSSGQEGILAHVSTVQLRDNVVTGTAMRGIAVTEMSRGVVEHNLVADVAGVGLYCGDLSRCDLAGNVVQNVAPDPDGGNSSSGHAVVAWFDSVMRLRDNVFDVAAEPVGLYLGGYLTQDSPID